MSDFDEEDAADGDLFNRVWDWLEDYEGNHDRQEIVMSAILDAFDDDAIAALDNWDGCIVQAILDGEDE